MSNLKFEKTERVCQHNAEINEGKRRGARKYYDYQIWDDGEFVGLWFHEGAEGYTLRDRERQYVRSPLSNGNPSYRFSVCPFPSAIFAKKKADFEAVYACHKGRVPTLAQINARREEHARVAALEAEERAKAAREEAIRDAGPELLAALEEIARNDPFKQSSAGIIARAAIAKVTGSTA